MHCGGKRNSPGRHPATCSFNIDNDIQRCTIKQITQNSSPDTPFDSLGLSNELLHAVSDQGYTTPTPVQRQAIPVILEGKDILAGAQTGTGKTAGFALPLLQLLSNRPSMKRKNGIRALILTPTRELAAQVEESVAAYGSYLPLKSTVIFGGVKINPQIARLRQGVDILVATPGRLLDHVQQQTLDLSAVEILVLDEADRMLDMGFIRDIRKILALLPRRRQNLLFFATFSADIKKLAEELLQSPVLIEVARRNTAAETVEQRIHPVDRTRKRELLSHLIVSNDWRQVLVFTRTKHGANRLTLQLQHDGVSAAAIHGNKSQEARTRSLADFKRGDVRVLVATDVASRGLDIDQLPYVVNFELPNVPEDYIHRIGRTGRADCRGTAVSLVCKDELELLKDIERLLRSAIPQQTVEGFEPDPTARAEGTSGVRADTGERRKRNHQPRNLPGNSMPGRKRATDRKMDEAPGCSQSRRGDGPCGTTRGVPARRSANSRSPLVWWNTDVKP